MAHYDIHIHGGSVNIAPLHMVPRSAVRHDSMLYAAEAAKRLLFAADTLNDERILGLQITPRKENCCLSIYSDENADITAEDLSWILENCANATTIGEGSIVDFSEFSGMVYIIEPSSHTSENEDVKLGKSEAKGYLFQLIDLISKSDGVVRLAICTGNAVYEKRYMFLLAVKEKITLTMRTLISMAFPGMTAREVVCFTDECEYQSYGWSRTEFTDLLTNLLIKAMDAEQDASSDDDSDAFDSDEERWDRLIKEKAEYLEYRYDLTDDSPVEDLDLSVRSYNCLRRAGVDSLGKLMALSDDDLKHIRNLGVKSFCEIKAVLTRIILDGVEDSCEDGIDFREGDIKSSVCSEAVLSSFNQLDDLIGLEEVKLQVRKIAAFARMRKDMESNGITTAPLAMNMEFIGNPGTAKTTVARLMAGILFKTGILASREMIEVGRADLVAEYVGQTAEKVKRLFKRASGKIIFIDEAYSLVDSNANSFGDEAINTIVQEMENNRNNTIVIFAGYPDKMRDFFSRNPGMRSRVPFTINFRDYSAEEMVQITEHEARKRGFTIDENAKHRLMRLCKTAVGNPDKGNGRFCRNIVENAIMDYAVRIYGNKVPKEPDFILSEEDFKSEEKQHAVKSRRSIGFTV